MYVVYTRLCLQYFHILLLAQCPQYFSYVFFQLSIDFFPAVRSIAKTINAQRARIVAFFMCVSSIFIL